VSPPRPIVEEERPLDSHAFREERRRATNTCERRRSAASHAVTPSAGHEQAELRGFEMAFVPKSKLFGKSKNPRLLGRFVQRRRARCYDT
jgi:hypothetical protein